MSTLPAGITPATLAAFNASAIGAQVKHRDHAPSNPDMPDGERLAILVEEVGEIARALTYDAGGDPDALRLALEAELLQLGAVAGMWVDALNPHATASGRLS